MKHSYKNIYHYLLSLIVTFLLFATIQAHPLQQENRSPDRARETGPGLLCTARIIYLNIRSEYINSEALERELLKRPEFRRWGMAITRNKENAELIIEVTRKKFSTRFTISVIDPDTNLIIASDSDTSIGGTIEPKLASKFIKQVKAACRED